ncbi:MAG: AraC-like DNA-binding protein [Polaribacter sp.]|jgi:AraC-like DNA-binding protein
MALSLGISERDLFRKVKEMTGLTPQKYLRKHRLNQAMLFLNGGKYRTVKETCYAVGYTNASYFVSQFEKEFGKKPLQVLREKGWR